MLVRFKRMRSMGTSIVGRMGSRVATVNIRSVIMILLSHMRQRKSRFVCQGDVKSPS